jgi:hypothetical protein
LSNGSVSSVCFCMAAHVLKPLNIWLMIFLEEVRERMGREILENFEESDEI